MDIVNRAATHKTILQAIWTAMLLTSGQISVAISSGVVCVFTTLLFLSGYVLQQQTVRSLQAAIHPPAPPVPTLNPVLAKHFGRPPGHSFYDKYLASNRPKGGWAKAAYVQLLRSHMHVCNAVMIFAVLEDQESMAQRIIMYPRQWNDDSKKDDREVATSRRLLREAASRHKVMLQPIEPIFQPAPAEGEKAQVYSDEEKYPLTNLLSLINFNRIIYLQPSGLILDATPLDLLFTLPMEENPMLGLSSPTQSSADRPAILLIEPSQALYQSTMAALPEGAYPDPEFLAQVHVAPAPATKGEGESTATLMAETSSLHHAAEQFNATQFLDTTGYVHYQDEGVLGPQYDLTQDYFKAAPEQREAKVAWMGVYERFREGRMDACGLDLEPVVVTAPPSEVEEVGEESSTKEAKIEGQSQEVAVGPPTREMENGVPSLEMTENPSNQELENKRSVQAEQSLIIDVPRAPPPTDSSETLLEISQQDKALPERDSTDRDGDESVADEPPGVAREDLR